VALRLLWFAIALTLAGLQAALAQAPVAVVPLEGAIGPAAADFVKRSIERAAKDGAFTAILNVRDLRTID